ncbi:hypothetical protein PILCRDRAFT_821447 [Piloderma croceum F 1598]|uniref:Polyketide synthase phosphopantetheine-binding domain-containing protein n=1 Tax=Piloderma croceum (strain F 1598) TaxID=765440 RepID=A0A0C3FQB0_PILCF|nr:hypothetical protein PILCRDRAFT_821447 [Piloderma croceum F 1598]
MAANNYVSLPIPAPPQTQALNSPTFILPPLDGSLTLPEICDFHLKHSPNHPVFVYADELGTTRSIVWHEVVRGLYQAGHIVRSRVEAEGLEPAREIPIVALLCLSDTITYLTTVFGIIRAGYAAFLISPRNSPAAVAHLLSTRAVTHILIGTEQSLQNLATVSLDMIKGRATERPTVSFMPLFDELYSDGKETTFDRLPFKRPSMNDLAIILHSSGSTAFPKTINWNHYRMLQFAAQPYYWGRDMTGKRVSCHGMPMFHGMGMIYSCWLVACGITVTAFRPSSPATTPNPESIIKGLMDSKSDIIVCAPSLIEAWSLDPNHVASLKKLENVAYGGGPLSQQVGDGLIEQGVPISIAYGMTEIGCISVLPSSGEVDRDWDYFKISKQMKASLNVDQDVSELVFIPHPAHAPCVFNSKGGDMDVYATGDLLMPHPERPGLWKILGRVDDQITHSNGEKTNPGPLENILNQDPHVRSSVMFGRGQFNAGVLIDPAPEHIFDPAQGTLLGEFRNKIWPTIQRMNDYAPQQSRVFKEMILVASSSKPFFYTIKGPPRRQAVIDSYGPEIMALYATVDETSQSHVEPPTSWSDSDSLDFVRTTVSNVMNQPVGDTDDLFQHGCDSLQATWIRNLILQALRKSTQSNTRLVSANIVYEHPSILTLATFVCQFALSIAQNGHRKSANRVEEMLTMVKAYSQGFPKHRPSIATPAKDVVMVTGTTGSFGSVLLAELVACNDVTRVFAVNRKDPGGTMLSGRQEAALERQGLNRAIATSPKVTLVEADLRRCDLGLPADVLKSIRSSVTHIIHNAWRVDFNLALQSFEPHVKGVRNLIDLALTSPHANPPHLLFMSSVGVFRQYQTVGPAKESPIEPKVAAGSGYSEAKWVSEKIFEIAADETPLKPTIIRVGQICGGPNGFWNDKEWLPSLIRSSVYMKCLPSIEQLVEWIPSAIAAKAVTEMRRLSTRIVHLAHPRPISWSTLFEAFSDTLNIPLVPFAEWLARLEKSREALATASAEEEAKAIRNNPALRLIEFFRGISSHEATSLSLSLDEAEKASETLRDENLSQLSVADVKLWVSYWRGTGSLSQDEYLSTADGNYISDTNRIQ